MSMKETWKTFLERQAESLGLPSGLVRHLLGEVSDSSNLGGVWVYRFETQTSRDPGKWVGIADAQTWDRVPEEEADLFDDPEYIPDCLDLPWPSGDEVEPGHLFWFTEEGVIRHLGWIYFMARAAESDQEVRLVATRKSNLRISYQDDVQVAGEIVCDLGVTRQTFLTSDEIDQPHRVWAALVELVDRLRG